MFPPCGNSASFRIIVLLMKTKENQWTIKENCQKKIREKTKQTGKTVYVLFVYVFFLAAMIGELPSGHPDKWPDK